MKPLKYYLLLVALLPAAPLFAQFDFPTLFGAGAAMGGMSVALPDEGSLTASVAGLSRLQSPTAAVAFRQDFSTAGLGYAAVAAALPTSAGGWGSSFVHYGNSDYNEQRLSLAYSLPAWKSLTGGVAFLYLHSGTSDPRYTPQNLITFSATLRYAPTKALTLAFKAYNPIGVEYDVGSHLPALLTFGVSYLLLDELLAAAEAEKDIYGSATLRMGLQYTFHDNYSIRTGFCTQPIIYTFGVGIKIKHMAVDLAAQLHSVLGFTPNLALFYRF